MDVLLRTDFLERRHLKKNDLEIGSVGYVDSLYNVEPRRSNTVFQSRKGKSVRNVWLSFPLYVLLSTFSAHVLNQFLTNREEFREK